jgi:hypothetical protein
MQLMGEGGLSLVHWLWQLCIQCVLGTSHLWSPCIFLVIALYALL